MTFDLEPGAPRPDEPHSGTVVRWRPEQGWGFVEDDEGGQWFIVLWRDLPEGREHLDVGARVAFRWRGGLQGPDMPRAEHLEPLDEAPGRHDDSI